jgi:hypothetical protein
MKHLMMRRGVLRGTGRQSEKIRHPLQTNKRRITMRSFPVSSDTQKLETVSPISVTFQRSKIQTAASGRRWES